MAGTEEPEGPITFTIPGVRRDGVSRGDARFSGLPAGLGQLDWEVRGSVEVASRRAGGAAHRLTARPGQDVVVLHIENGPSLVLHPATARDLLIAQTAKPRGIGRGSDGTTRLEAAPGEVDVVPRLQWQGLESTSVVGRGATRGVLGDVILRVIDVIGLRERAQQMLAGELARRLDDRVKEGVYALRADGLTALKDQPALDRLPPAPAGAASLVFVHGTFSTTSESGFANLWSLHPGLVKDLFHHYDGRVYALDHATVGRSPIHNALTLVRACPPDTRLHLVTHSRGGLVAEVLTRCVGLPSLDDAAKTLFGGADWQPQRDALEELIDLVRERNIQVDRTVRVACPARGTLLASRRLDAYLSVLRWALNLAGLPVVPEMVDFLAGVARERTDPATLPGLAVMVPDSPLVQWLHAAEKEAPGELRVVAGDLQGDSVTSWLKTLMADAFYWTDNDLVVQTRSMYGGVPRAAEASFMLDRSGASSHFNYFSHERTAAAIVRGLIEASPSGWRTIGPLSYAGASSEGVRGARRGGEDGGTAAQKPAVIVLPGILGSHLRVNGRRIWLSWRFLNGFSQLEYPEPADRHIEPDGPIGLTYEALMDFLAASHEVISFSYDWRKPMEEEARRLGEEVETALDAREQSGLPVRLLAHSMGGLLARALQMECGPLWDRLFAREGARLVMLGTPNAGSWAPMRVLSGDDGFGSTLTGVGAPFQDHRARELLAGFPGFLQLQAGLLDRDRPLRTCEGWRKLAEDDLNLVRACSWWHRDERQLDAFRWGIPDDRVLGQAVRFSEKLHDQRERDLPLWRDRLALVVGAAPFTTDGYEIAEEGLMYLDAAGSGDGRVTDASAMLPGVRTWRLGSEHGRLPAEKEAFMAFKELLETGDTSLLPRVAETAASRGAGAGEATTALRRSRPSRERGTSEPRTSDDDLYRLSLEADTSEPGQAQDALPITVLNGNLKFVSRPLMLGHYASSTLTGTERAVDLLIGGTMAEALAMGCYPDRPGSHQVFLNTSINTENPLQPPRPEAVIVVGLGEEGELAASDLAYSVQMGVMAMAQRWMERPERGETRFELAATLLGSGGSRIDAGQAAQMIARGVRDADAMLRRRDRWPGVASLQLVELYLDRASQALIALQTLADAQPGAYRVADTVMAGQGWERQPPDWGYRGTDYDLISALTGTEPRLGRDARERDSSSMILYTMDTRRARTEWRAQSTQRGLVEKLVAQASNAASRDGRIGRTLYRLLVPPEMESAMGGASDLVLEVDQGSAGIPWEMLDTESGTRRGGDSRPWAIRTKLLRKLRLPDFRQQPRDAGRAGGALVIGEPLLTDRDGASYPRLPGARAEAEAVAEQLERCLGSDRVRRLIGSGDAESGGADAIEVISSLLERDWRVVHVSGHGVPPEPGGDPRGVVLSHGLYLGPREIRTMRVVPELVFVNCCHLAASDPERLLSGTYNRAEFASTVAGELIRIGVRCVVAAGWAVEDEAAKIFAQEFYAWLLRGMRFIDAIAEARQAAWGQSGNTWAAYQCYGDPDWVLQPNEADSQLPRATMARRLPGVVSPAALTLVLESLKVKGTFQDMDQAQLGRDLDQLESRFAPLWGNQGEVAHAFAEAWNAAGHPDKAIRWYERALQAEDGKTALRSYEQLANLQVRQAWRRVEAACRKAEETPVPAATEATQVQAAAQLQQELEEARGVIQRAGEALQKLTAIGATMERFSLSGSAQKRLAMLERRAGDREAEKTALAAMKAFYAQAENLGVSNALPDVFYPALNRLAAECVLHADNDAWGGFDAITLAALRESLAHKVHSDPDFWSEVGLIELDLYEALSKRTLSTRLAAIRDAYARLHLRMKHQHSWRSARDQLQFVLPAYIERMESSDPREADAARTLLLEVTVYAG